MNNCPACQSELPAELPAGVCPCCGVTIDPQARPGWVVSGIDLLTVARRQRLILWLLTAQLALYVMALVQYSGRGAHVYELVRAALYLGTAIAIIVVVVQLMSALRMNILERSLGAIFSFTPCLSLFVLLSVNGRATKALTAAGLRVGFWGVSDESVRRVLGRYVCRTCGYSLVGNTSGRCPECGAPCDGQDPSAGVQEAARTPG